MIRVVLPAIILTVVACAHAMTPQEARDACSAKHGMYVVDDRNEESPDAGEPAGTCVERSPEGGRRCTSSNQCRCICDPADDGKKAVGTCADFPPRPGSGWQCTIDENGIAHAHGIIVGATSGFSGD